MIIHMQVHNFFPKNPTVGLSTLVLFTLVFAHHFLPRSLAGPALIILGITLAIMSSGSIKRDYLQLIWPLFGVVVIGLLRISEREPADILRDFCFSATPVSLVYIGYWLADKGAPIRNIFRIIVVCGIVASVLYIVQFIQNPTLFGAGLIEVRSAFGLPNSIFVIALAIFLHQKQWKLGALQPKAIPRIIVLLLLVVTLVLSFSRTDFLVLVVLSIGLRGLLTKLNARILIVIAVAAVGYVTVGLTTPADEVGTLRSKISRTFTEISVANYEDNADVNNNWRGFETFKVLETVSAGTTIQKIFGQGFGALADLGLYMQLGDKDYRYISITHNGYAYILLKTGVVGVLLYVIFYIKIIKFALRNARHSSGAKRSLSNLLLGVVFALIAVMYIIGGMAQMGEPVLVVLIGYLIRAIRRNDFNGIPIEPSRFRDEISLQRKESGSL